MRGWRRAARGCVAALGMAAVLTAAAGCKSAPMDGGADGSSWRAVNAAMATLAGTAGPASPGAARPAPGAAASGTAAAAAPAAASPAAAAAPPAVTPAASPPAAQPASPGGLLVDLNRATVEILTQLPGIGPAKARAVAAYRDAHGPFRAKEDLLRVKGIGPKTYERLKDRIQIIP